MKGYNSIDDPLTIEIQGGNLILFYEDYNVRSKFATNISLMLFHLFHMLNKSKNIK